MIAYKFLGADGLGRFSGFVWPVPADGAAGAWVDADFPLAPCKAGIHACRLADLPYWLDVALWEAELDGELLVSGNRVVGQRGRLLRKIEAWDSAAQLALADFCIARAAVFADKAARDGRPHADFTRTWADNVVYFAGIGQVATAAYVAAVAAHGASDLAPDAAYAAERAEQATFLAQLLAL